MAEHSTEWCTILQNPYLTLRSKDNLCSIQLHYKEGNPLDAELMRSMIHAYDTARRHMLGDTFDVNGACLILTGSGVSTFSTGVPMEDEERGKGNILRDAFAPLLVAILNFPFPTICSINGKCEGGACVIAMSHDYRILDSDQGSISFDAIHLGAHFIGICSVMREKLNHQSAKMMCLEGHIFTPNEALKHDIADGLAKQNALERLSETLARRVAIFGKHGAYGLMRREIMSDSIAKIMMNCQ